MALTERNEYDSLNVLLDGQIQLRRSRIFLDDGKEVSRTYWRTVLVPGSDVSAFPERVQRLCAHIWTPDVIEAYERFKERSLLSPEFPPRL